MIRFEEIPAILGELLLEGTPPSWPRGEVRFVEQDSRRIHGGQTVFIAIPGSTGDGRAFIPDAASRGAQAAIGPPPPPQHKIPYLCVSEPRKAVAILSARSFGDPSHEVDVVGVTGTNGKTTTTWLLQSIWEECGIRAAVSGTLGSGDPRTLTGTTHTTPDAPRFQQTLHDMAMNGFRAVAAEVSSHALDQYRTYATRFRCAVFTNLTRDHLDYHGTPEAYLGAKRRLFNSDGRGDLATCPAVVNLDDPAGRAIVAGSRDPLRGYGTVNDAYMVLKSMEVRADGLTLRIRGPGGDREILSPLIGAFNGWNVLAAYTTSVVLGLPEDAVARALARGVQVPGRMERVERGQPFLVIVDYAHTPDALGRVLDTLRPLTRGKLILLFGCGGDRDHGKRPEMGRIASSRADRIFLTNDNPRSEDPQGILDAIIEGIRAVRGEPTLVEPDRSAAIHAALSIARPGDTVLLAGKGHEAYQESATGRRNFDDRVVAADALSKLGWVR